MMIYAALRWPEHNKRNLWPLPLSHAVHLHNEIPSKESRLTPHKIWARSKSSFGALVHAHPWGCPLYVLQPQLQDGGKVPKWEPQSRQGQYMGASPLHASTVGLVQNLQTNHISPQFHVVYDDLFETVHASSSEAPASWPDLFTFNRFKSNFDDEDFVPTLPDKWSTPVELSQQKQRDRAQCSQDGATSNDEPIAPNYDDRHEDAMESQRAHGAPPETSQRAPDAAPPDASQRAPLVSEDGPSLGQDDSEPDLESPTPVRCNPHRSWRSPKRYRQHGFTVVRSYCKAMVSTLLLMQGQLYDNQYLLNLLLDHDFGLYKHLSPNSQMMAPHAMKASSTHDPDTPRLHEAMRGEG
jgi:hypothetical protein